MRAWDATFYLHGFGSDGSTFGAWFDTTRELRPHVFLDGPEHDDLTSARRWFPFTANRERLARRVQCAAALAEVAIIDRLVALGLDVRAPLALVGHSQGALVVLEIFRRGALNVVEVSCYAGFHPAPAAWPERSSRAVVALHSSMADRYVCVADVDTTFEHLAKVPGIHVSHFVSVDLDHHFDEGWLCPSRFELRGTSYG